MNRPIHVFKGYKQNTVQLPVILSGEGLSMEIIKKAEKLDVHIIRVIETLGKFSEGILSSKFDKTKWIETNLLEWENGKVYTASNLKIKLNPFEIKTWKVNLN